MTITTFEEWYEEHGKGAFKSDELPPIILNPEFVDLWKDEWEGYLDLWYFLEVITEESSTNHYEIIRQLSIRGIHTEGVGGGMLSNKLYAYIYSNGVDNPINEYLKNHLIIMKTNNNKLYWKGWYFPASMFVFNESMNNSFSINWPTRNPMEGK